MPDALLDRVAEQFRALSEPSRLKWFNITMAVLLVVSLWPMLK